jgi:hypothetical protein
MGCRSGNSVKAMPLRRGQLAHGDQLRNVGTGGACWLRDIRA